MTNEKEFTIQTPAGEVGYGDLIRYKSNGVSVCIYARKLFNGWIVDGNVMCDPRNVVEIVHRKLWQML